MDKEDTSVALQWVNMVFVIWSAKLQSQDIVRGEKNEQNEAEFAMRQF